MLVVVTTLAAACASAPPAATTPHPELETAEIAVDGAELTVWVADSGDERGQGLRNVGSLPQGVHGMLFVWDSPSTPSFGMRDTLMPLDLWWFAPDGSLIGKTEMSICPDGNCVSYPAPGPVLFALETPAGAYSFALGARLTTSANA